VIDWLRLRSFAYLRLGVRLDCTGVQKTGLVPRLRWGHVGLGSGWQRGGKSKAEDGEVNSELQMEERNRRALALLASRAEARPLQIIENAALCRT
jgi:hypothetical protein